MQFHLITLAALLATATAQSNFIDSLTAAAGSAFKSKASTALSGAAASYTGIGSGVLSSLISSGIPSATSTGSLASSLSSAAAAATSTGAANHNQVAQVGLGAVVAVGLLGVVV